mmetsp:Transcript_60031/g.130198  ORF Transcript_60031/g.130198 Transcript_60031/m.130198 type:complete len:239 (+) Transcript_60031:43-759(+)
MGGKGGKMIDPSQNKTTIDWAEFEGNESTNILPGLGFFRSDSVEVTNDPRIFLDNVLSRRLGAFETVVVASVLVASVSCSTLIVMEEKKESWTEYVGLVGMTVVFVMNLFCVLVITQQYYQIFRLMTAGPTGFEISKSYYLNKNVATLRHMSTNAFFKSIPIFVGSIGIMVFQKLRTRWLVSIPVLVVILTVAVLLHIVNRKHASIFYEKYILTKRHEAPLMGHLRNMKMDINRTGDF